MNFDYDEKLKEISKLPSKEIALKIEFLEKELFAIERDFYKKIKLSNRVDKGEADHINRLRSIIYDLEDIRREKEIKEEIERIDAGLLGNKFGLVILGIILIFIFLCIFLVTTNNPPY